MDQTANQVHFEFPHLFRIFKDGRIDRFQGEEVVPADADSQNGVKSKDVVVSPETGVSARIFIPQIPDPTRKLPLIVFFHGGAFVVETPFSPAYHLHASSLASEANAVVFSIHYRRAPEHPLPIAYDDAWDAIRWAAAHSGGNGPEPWLNRFADFGRVSIAGDSAGANIAHNVALRAGVEDLGLKISGMILYHPYFGNDEPEKLLEIIFPTMRGLDDPRVKPGSGPDLGKLGCEKVLVCVAEKDFLKGRGLAYYEALKKSGWGGVVEIVETDGEGHVFHLFNPTCDKAVALMNKVVSFLEQA
ncbi:hypothetical protein UlMin_043409 [Ulmus minor]